MESPVPAPEQDASFYYEGAKRMVAEGKESVSKIMAFMNQRKSTLADMPAADRKKAVLEFEPAKMFNQVHPIVFQYLTVEGVYSATAFKRYVMAVFGKPKNKEVELKMREDRRYVYHFKNAQQALYYKYLLIDTNPNVDKTQIHAMYESVVKTLNEKTDRMLSTYKEAEERAKADEELFSQEKRRDLVNYLQKKLSKP
jgi:hypothetical protein